MAMYNEFFLSYAYIFYDAIRLYVYMKGHFAFKTFHVTAMKRDEAIFYAQFRCPGYHKSVIATAQKQCYRDRG